MKKEKTVNLNGTYYSAGKLISTANRAFLYGDSVFESIRCDGEILLWGQHYARLLRAAAAMGFIFSPWWTEDYFRYEIKKTLHQNKFHSARVRLILFREEESMGYAPTSDRCSYLIDVDELAEPAFATQENGLRIGVFEDAKKYPGPFSFFKSGQSLIYVLAARKARNEAWDEILILNEHGRVCESSSGNVWVVKDNKILTPPVEENGISGIMRDHLLKRLPEFGMEVHESKLSQDDLHLSDEIWISNAVRGVRWVAEWDFRKYKSEVAIQVQKLLHQETLHHD